MEKCVKQTVEELRTELHKLIAAHGLNHPDVLAVSHRLDVEILKEMKKDY